MAVARGDPGRLRREGGQASLELLGMLPLLIALALAATQLLAVGYSSVLAGNAAEAGALALAAGGDVKAGVREALPAWSRTRAHIATSEGRIVVRPARLDLLGAAVVVDGDDHRPGLPGGRTEVDGRFAAVGADLADGTDLPVAAGGLEQGQTLVGRHESLGMFRRVQQL